MRRGGRIAALLALALTLAAAPAARAETGVLRLTGSTTAYVDVTLDHGVNVVQWAPRTTGGYVGFYVARLDVPPTSPEALGYGSLVVNRFAAPSGRRPEIVLGMRPASYGKGRFRIWLITDGPAVVTLQTGSDLPELRLRPAHRVPADVRVAPLAAGPTVSARTPVTAVRPSVAATALMLTGAAPATSDVDVCVAAPRAACPDRSAPVWPGSSVDPVPVPGPDTRVWTMVQRLGKGRYDAVHHAVSRAPLDRAIAASFVMPVS